jgi:uncharacterized protein YjcR
MKKTFRLWSKKDDLELRKLWVDGIKVKDIAEKLNRPIPARTVRSKNQDKT